MKKLILIPLFLILCIGITSFRTIEKPKSEPISLQQEGVNRLDITLKFEIPIVLHAKYNTMAERQVIFNTIKKAYGLQAMDECYCGPWRVSNSSPNSGCYRECCSGSGPYCYTEYATDCCNTPAESIIVGRTQFLAKIDEKTNLVYKLDSQMLDTWIQWKKFVFVRYARPMDV